MQEEKKGSGTWRVISSAGGSLNYLKIRGIKSEASYWEDARDRHLARQAESKARLATDKASGLHAEKQAARAQIQGQVRAAEEAFIALVGKAQGWDEAVLRGETAPHFPPEAQESAAKGRHRALLAKARQAVNLQREALLNDADLRAAALTTGIPLEGATGPPVSAPS